MRIHLLKISSFCTLTFIGILRVARVVSSSNQMKESPSDRLTLWKPKRERVDLKRSFPGSLKRIFPGSFSIEKIFKSAGWPSLSEAGIIPCSYSAACLRLPSFKHKHTMSEMKKNQNKHIFGIQIQGSLKKQSPKLCVVGGSKALNFFSENTIQCLYGISAVEDFSPWNTCFMKASLNSNC